jgi:hypothetical protein
LIPPGHRIAARDHYCAPQRGVAEHLCDSLRRKGFHCERPWDLSDVWELFDEWAAATGCDHWWGRELVLSCPNAGNRTLKTCSASQKY